MEGGTGAGVAIEPDLSAVQLDEEAADVQAQTGASCARAPRFSSPEKAAKDLRLVFRRDAHALVYHSQLKESWLLASLYADLDERASGAVFAGIADQVSKDLHCPRAVTQGVGESLWCMHHNPLVHGIKLGLQGLDSGRYQAREAMRLQV